LYLQNLSVAVRRSDTIDGHFSICIPSSGILLLMNYQLPFPSGRQPVLARNVVSTSQPLASQAGANAFARGGNAIDAALAAAITLTVVEPTMNGIGGDAFAILWDGKALHGLNASGRAPAAWSPERFKGIRHGSWCGVAVG
jgi:gamma-glutamyltranspeptidase / glutathione hydrolase